MHDGLPFQVKIVPDNEQYQQLKLLSRMLPLVVLTMKEAKARTRKVIESVERDRAPE